MAILGWVLFAITSIEWKRCFRFLWTRQLMITQQRWYLVLLAHLHLSGILLCHFSGLANLESFLEGKIRLRQKSTLYSGVANTAHQLITQHIVQADIKCATCGQAVEFCHELRNHLTILLWTGVEGESLDGHWWRGVMVSLHQLHQLLKSVICRLPRGCNIADNLVSCRSACRLWWWNTAWGVPCRMPTPRALRRQMCCDCKKSNSLSKSVYLANNSTTDSRNCTERMHYRPIIKNSTQNQKGDPECSKPKVRYGFQS